MDEKEVERRLRLTLKLVEQYHYELFDRRVRLLYPNMAIQRMERGLELFEGTLYV